MNETLRKHFQVIEETMLSGYQIAKSHHHRGLIGKARELLFQQFLASHIPQHYEILNGEIIDAHGKTSSEQDLIIYDRSIPKLSTSPLTSVVLAEGAVLTIEVKSNLKSKDDILECLREAERIKALRKTKGVSMYVPTALEEDGRARKDESVRVVIVAFESGSLELFKETLREFYDGKQIEDFVDIIVLLGNAVLCKADGLLMEPKLGSVTNFTILEDGRNLEYLFFYIVRVLTRYGGAKYDFRDYIVS